MSTAKAPERPSFAALFNADLPAERVLFDVGAGSDTRECWIDLKPMDIAARAEGESLTSGAAQLEYLFSHMAADWHLWIRPIRKDTGKPGEWQECNASPDPDSRKEWARANLPHLAGPVGRWLIDQCMRVNAQTEVTEKN